MDGFHVSSVVVLSPHKNRLTFSETPNLSNFDGGDS